MVKTKKTKTRQAVAKKVSSVGKKQLKEAANKSISYLNKIARDALKSGYRLVLTNLEKGNRSLLHGKILQKEERQLTKQETRKRNKKPAAIFQTTVQKTHTWLNELGKYADMENEQQSYAVMRAVLHALRDRLMPEEAVHLGAQLPILIRGFYYEGWKPARTPEREKTKEAFIQHVTARFQNINPTVDPEKATRAVFLLLQRKVSAGEIEHIKDILPGEIKTLWPEN